VILYLLRHAIAEDVAPGGDDGARRLTARGRSRMRTAAAGLRRLGFAVDAIVTSPLPRAAETAAIVVEALGGVPEPRELAALGQGLAPPAMLRALRPFGHHPRLLVVGHEPGLSGLAALVLTGSANGMTLDLRKGGCVAIELEQLLPPRSAMLRWALAPRQLRLLARRRA
jgi:phosphohistidine phosphatase